MHDTCPSGHTYTAANTYTYNGHRQCRACRRVRSREYQRRLRATFRANKRRALDT